MTPRYPTSNRYRRHRKEGSPRAVFWFVLTGVLLILWNYWGPESSVDPEGAAVPVEEQILEEFVVEEVEEPIPEPPAIPPETAAVPKTRPESAKEEQVSLTFYNELPKRSVVLPVEEEPVQVKKQVRRIIKRRPASVSQANRQTSSPSQTTASRKASKGGVYVVQIAIYPNFRQAAKVAGNLQRKGAPASIVRVRSGSGSSQYKVRLGPFNSRDSAANALVRWKMPGVSAIIQRVSGG
ncbi:MAG: SPOR domain-containing protein [Magnetococcales bacterium]|nr:SPOR domain-containing protein [Magnetococcales bacterium]